ncbi:MAG TPA: oligoendopeptidase F [Phototrophicaceae bacterium]|nr:oligoendopeptidase F [Phototrophicaceae bacterium]
MATAQTVKFPPRHEIAKEHTWNAESVFASRAAWDAEFKHLLPGVEVLASYQGRLGQSPAVLVEFYQTMEPLMQRVGHIYVYAVMSQSCDSNDQEATAMVGQAGALFSKFGALTAFVEPELLAVGADTLRQWVKTEPGLQHLEQYIDNLFRRQAHVRSAEVEEVLGLATDPFGVVENTADLLTSSEIPFKPAMSSSGETLPVGQGTINKLLDSTDRETRRTGWENYADGYLAFKNTLASNLTAAIKRDVFFAQARRYPSALEAALFENNIPVAVFNNLIETFRKNIPTWHRYWAIRRRALGVETLHPYDIWAPLTANHPTIPYPQAVEWISTGMKRLGDDYAETLRRGCLEQRWVDIYPNQGKRQGAFSFGWQGTYPIIMMSYNERLQDLSTLAHELGHSMHSYYTWQTQPPVYARYSLFVAEVASNFNQAVVRDYLMQTNTDRDFQIAVIEEAMNNFHRYFFIMPTLARFELEAHQRAERGEGLTADSLNALMADLFAEGYGSEMTFDRERVGITWSQFPHMYMNFYVYQYATGISAAHALAEGVIAGQPGAVENYRKFLSSGSSLYAMDALKLAGVDMTTPAAVEKTFAVLARYVDRLDELTR